MPHLTHACNFLLMNENCIGGTRPSGRTGSLAKALDTVWEIPKPLAILEVPVDDGTIIILRRHGNPSGPRLVLCHGSGLAVDLYYPFWSLLTADFDLMIYDLRSHGWNDLGTLEDHHIPAFVRDHDRILEAIESRYGIKPTVGVFHSISAVASLLSPTKGSKYSALILFDPPLCRAGSSYEERSMSARRTADMLRRRQYRFKSRDELEELHRFLPVFRRAVPGVLELVARTTLRESKNGEGYELRCPPEYEAKIFNSAPDFALSVDLLTLQCPAKIVGSDPVLSLSHLPRFDFSEIANVSYDFLPETTHFLQLEKPKECVVAMRDFLSFG